MSNNEFRAANVESAIEDGLKALQITEEEADIEVLFKGGFLKKAVVRVSKKEELENTDSKIESQEQPSEGKNFIEEVLRLMNKSCWVEEKIKNEEYCYYIKGNDVSKIIGHRGEILDSLQLLASNIINKNNKEFQRVTVDADFYRKRREQTLESLAKRLAKKAMNTGAEIELEPMSAFERRVVHMTLYQSKIATTKSVGEGRDRHIVIIPLQGQEEKTVEYGSTEFSQKGPTKMRSFGYKKKRF